MSAARPAVLWVTQEVPDHGGGGGALRQANLLARLGSELDIDVLVAGRLTDPLVRAAVHAVVEVPVDEPLPPGRLRTLWELGARRRPLFLAASARSRRALATELRSRARAYDAVVVHHEELLPLLADVEHALRVLHVFDVKSVRAEQTARVAASPITARVWRTEAARARSVEERWVPRADLVVACTAADAADLGATRAVVAPNGVTPGDASRAPAPGAERALFFGSLDYEPNVDGITWFVREVWPRVRAQRAGATLTIAGHRPTPAVQALSTAPGVDVVGAVPDAAATYAAHDVVVVPLRVGTGSRLKALEAMAAGRAVVGTTVGLEGLGVEGPPLAGQAPPAMVEDEPARLATAVAGLLADPDRAAALGAAGRAHVAAGFDWDGIARDLGEALQAALADRLGPSGRRGISVVVCTRGRPALLDSALASLDAALSPEDELIVVEADGDAAAGAVASLRADARHLAAPRPGKSRQLNLGLRAARHEVVVLTDDDCEVVPGWLEAMAAPLLDPEVAIAFGPVAGLSGVRGVDVVAAAPGLPPAVTWEYANGAAMSVRRSAILDLGGFDERLGPGAPVHGEEHDVVLRAQEAGWQVRVAAAPTVRHLDWRDEDETRRNLLIYSRGAGAFIGAALRRAPRRHARLAVRRARYQAGLWRHRADEGAGFGPATSVAFARGLVRGLLMRPKRP